MYEVFCCLVLLVSCLLAITPSLTVLLFLSSYSPSPPLPQILGTGKTLMARQIGKMLHAREPKVISGPEVLDKFVGQSEANIR